MATEQEIEQKIAQKENELARLKKKKSTLANGQKVIIGGMMISLAKKDVNVARVLLGYIETEVTRDTDKKRLAGLIKQMLTFVEDNQE